MSTKSIRIVLILLGIFHVANGLFMLAAPDQWYVTVPGVPATGPFNHHFIVDIGLAFIASGAGLLMASRVGATAATLALAGSVWPALHGLFHLWGWIAEGIPSDPQILVSDAVAVMLASFLGFVLAWIWARREGVLK
jgi:hypothetical protein